MSLLLACLHLLDQVAADLGARRELEPWQEAQSTLLARLAELCRVFAWSLERGYTVPAMALGASLYELGYLSMFIADQNELALRWLEWSNLKRLPWRLREIRTGASRNQAGKAPEDRDDFWYALLAMAKHGNPTVARNLPVTLTGEAHIIEAHPFLSAKAALRVRLAIVAALRGALQALLVLARRGRLSIKRKKPLLELSERFVNMQAAVLSAARGVGA